VRQLEKMIRYLSIRDFAIIDRMEVEFDSGFTVMTGETGAGKSILVNALHLLLGGRAFEDMVRSDAKSAEVQGVFEFAQGSFCERRLLDLDLIEPGSKSFGVRRVVARSGRNRVFINDRSVNLSTLQSLARSLVDISGQHEHVSLTNEDSHRGWLDEYGGHQKILSDLGEKVDRFLRTKRELAVLDKKEHQRAEREDYIRFCLNRIDETDPLSGEDEALEQERMRLAHAERLGSGLRQTLGILYEQDASVVGLLGDADKEMQHLIRLDPSLKALAEQIGTLLNSVGELAGDMGKAAARITDDPERLDQVEQRLSALRGLMRSYGPALAQVIEKRSNLAREMEGLEHLSSRRQELVCKLKEQEKQAMEKAAHVRLARVRAGRDLSLHLQKELAELAMPEACWQVDLEEQSLDEHGVDRVRFLFSANPGEPVRPLAKVASGGELSRVLLSLKTVMIAKNQVESEAAGTYVFDEVDSGVSGAVAVELGSKLACLSDHHQVLCITHLPQIAALGRVHFSLRKVVEGGRTRSMIQKLSKTERIEELARMVGGRQVTEKARGHAQELLHRAGLAH
jgi:DNA repair protein RecN (Recombination protein N)